MTPMEDVDQYARRLLADLITENTNACRLRRAQQLLDARPRPGDYVGNSTVEQRREAWRRCTETAQALQSAASIAPIRAHVEQDVAAVWGEEW